MSDVSHGVPDRFRAIQAVAIAMALVLMAPGVDALARVGPSLSAGAAENAGIHADFLAEAPDPYAALDRIEGLASAGGGRPSGIFMREIGLLPDAEDVRVDATGTVVGYVVEGDAADVYEQLLARMRAAGWEAVSLGKVEGATFVKQQGGCTWALATCAQVGQSTSVVVRCVYEN